ncbi:hypothetical protein [Streptomyces sp. NPDC051554]|uniref:hypothetical protein n=1 Tax=Streptomyces sp. NPDC051554 TaxID=3365656 RepID=UPI003794BB6E
MVLHGLDGAPVCVGDHERGQFVSQIAEMGLCLGVGAFVEDLGEVAESVDAGDEGPQALAGGDGVADPLAVEDQWVRDAGIEQPFSDAGFRAAGDPCVGEQDVAAAQSLVHQCPGLGEFVAEAGGREGGVGFLGVFALQDEGAVGDVLDADRVWWLLPGAVEGAVVSAVVGVGEGVDGLCPHLAEYGCAQVLEGAPAQGVQGEGGGAGCGDAAWLRGHRLGSSRGSAW